MCSRLMLDSGLIAPGSLKAIHKKGKNTYLEDRGRKVKMTVCTNNRGKPEIEGNIEDLKFKTTIR